MNKKLCLKKIISMCMTIIMTFSLMMEGVVALPVNEYGKELIYAELGTNVKAVNCTVANGDSRNPNVVFEQGKEAWKLDPSNGTSNRYIYVDIDDSIMYDCNDGTTIEVEVEYYDLDDGSITLEYPKYEWLNVSAKRPKYDGTARKASSTELEIVDFGGTGKWRSHTWTLDRAWLCNSLNGYDFRICAYSATMQYSKTAVLVHSIKVRDTGYKDVMDIEVKSENLGNIFFSGDTMEFEIEVDNSISYTNSLAKGNIDAEISYMITDSDGHEMYTETRDAKINAMEIYREKFSWKPEKYDCYVLTVVVKSKDGTLLSDVSRDCSYVRSTKGEIQNPRSGISFPTWLNAYSGADKDYPDQIAKLISYAGFSYARIHHAMQQTAMSAYDNFTANEIAAHTSFGDSVKALKNNNVKVMMYVPMFWKLTNNPKDTSRYFIEEEGPAVAHTDAGRKRFLTLERGIISEFYGAVDVWEIGNEPNLWSDRMGDDYHAKDMADYDNYAYPKLKEEFPGLVIGTENLSGTNRYGKWWENYFASGGANVKQDFISIHPYNAVFDSVTGTTMSRQDLYDYEGKVWSLVESAKKYGYEGEVWATEYGKSPGWYGCPKNDWYQAVWNACAYINMTEDDIIDKMILFRLDRLRNDTRNTLENSYGIIKTLDPTKCENPGAACLSYLAESNRNIMMHDAKFIEKFGFNNNTVGFRYDKTETGDDMLVMFGNKELDIISVDLGVKSVLLTDMLGNEQTLTSDDGVYTLSATLDPFYLTGDFDKFEIVDRSEAYPRETIVSTVYNNEVEIEIVNTTEKTLNAEFDFDGYSTTTVVGSNEVKPGVSTVVLKSGSSYKKPTERIKLRLTDDENTYFSGYVVLDYQTTISMSSSLLCEDGEWNVMVTVENLSTEPVSGTVKMMYPTDLAESIAPVDIVVDGKSSTTCGLLMTDSVQIGESVTATLVFEVDGNVESYSTERLDFVYVSRAKNVKIDAYLDEWDSGWMNLNRYDQFEQIVGYNNDYRGSNDIWAKVALKWDEDYLYFASEVHDDVFFAEGVTADNMWQLDDFQIAFLYDPEGTVTLTNNFEEISFAKLNGTPTVYRHKTIRTDLSNVSEVPGSELAIEERGGVVYYEGRFPWSSLLPPNWAQPAVGAEFKFGLILNENDGNGRKGYYKLGDGIGGTKDSSKFLKMYLFE